MKMNYFANFFVAILLVISLTNSCTFLPDAVDKMVDPLKTGPFGYLEISGSTEPQTKLTMEVNDGGTGTKSALYWSANDSIGVFLTDGTNTYHAKYITTSSAVTAAHFNLVQIKNVTGGTLVSTTTENPAIPAGTYTVYAYYPYNDASLDPASVKYTLNYIQFQDGKNNTDHIGTFGFAFAPSQNVTIPENAYSSVVLNFRMRTSILELYIPSGTTQYRFEGGSTLTDFTVADKAIVSYLFYDETGTDHTINQTTGAINLTSYTTSGLPSLVSNKGRSQVAIVCTDNNNAFGNNSKAYIQFIPDNTNDASRRYAIGMRLPNNNDTYRMKNDMTPPSGGFQAGKKYRITFSNPLVLTKLFEDLTNGQHRLANTYIVPSPAIEKVHQSYGFVAAVEGSDINTPTGTTVNDYTSGTQWTPTDLIVSSPVIIFEEGYTNTGNYTNEVVDGIVNTAGDYFYFKIKEDIQTANVLIGALNYSSASTDDFLPMWSWHIWVRDKVPDTILDDHEENDLRDDIKNPDTNIVQYADGDFMDCNLGALSTEPTADHFLKRGLLYQWGRTFPLRTKAIIGGVLSDATNNTDGIGYYSTYFSAITRYKQSSYTGGGTGRRAFASDHYSKEYTTPGAAVRHVYKFIYKIIDSGGNWWGFRKNNEDDTWLEPGTDNSVCKKTRFDPCPWGWMVPTKDQMAAKYPSSTDLPAGGMINPSTHTIDSYIIVSPETEGFYWTSSANALTTGKNDAISLHFDTANSTFSNNEINQKRIAGSIRCVRHNADKENNSIIGVPQQ